MLAKELMQQLACCIISSLHMVYRRRMKTFTLCCVGLNKNSANIHYLLWRVMTGRHKNASLSFMLVGHTKFGPDSFYGLFKQRYVRSYVSTMYYIKRAVMKERKYHSFKCTMCTHNVTNEMKNKCNTFELLTSLGQQDTSTMCWAWQGRK